MPDVAESAFRRRALNRLGEPTAQYALAIAAVIAATLLRIPFEGWLFGRAPYGLYFPVLVAVAWYCGVRPTLVAAALAFACAWFFFVPPTLSWFPKEDGYGASIVVYAASAAGLIVLARVAAGARRELVGSFSSRARLAAIVESSDDAIIGKDLDGVIQSWNAGAERLFGYRADEVIGRHITVLIPTERRAEEDRILASLRRGERIDHFETERLSKDGRRLEVSLTVSPIRDASGRIVGASKIARDVTERRAVERALAQQREWFRVTLASIGDAVITTDRDGAVRYMNPVAERLTGSALSHAHGRPLAEIFHVVDERTRAPIDSPCDRVLRTGAVVGLANHSALLARDGTEHPIEDSAAPIVDGGGSVIGVALVFHDVSERRRAEQALAEQREWLETTLVSIGDAVIATDVRGCITFMNPVAERLTGWRSLEAEGRDCTIVFRIVNETTRSVAESPVARVLREGLIVGLANHTVLIARDGSERPIDDSAAPIRRGDGEIAGVVLVFRDVSERRQVERERQSADRERERLLQSERAARSEAERANRVKDDFVATMSHELRTPLNAILGWAQILSGQPPDAETLARGLSVIERNTRLQAELISDLLDVSRIVSGKLRLELLLVDIGTIVEQALDTIRFTADEKGVPIRCEIDRAIGPIAGDSARLQQVVWNLLSNAVKFSPAGGQVDVRVEHEGAHAKITVTDTGVGIRPDFLPYLFERFRQADASTTRRFGGLGLGLTIVKQLVELHGGTVDAHSEGEGKGASFAVRLPLHAQLAAAGPQPGAFTTGASPDATRLEGVRVLVVEDEPDARELVVRVLSEAGCGVTSVDSAEAALAAFAAEPPHLLISDIGLPEQDGYTLIQRIRRFEQGDARALPAIALTAFARSEDRTRALRAGYQAHIAKPVDPAELLATVASFAQIATAGRAIETWEPRSKPEAEPNKTV